jgi:hypothetical protein
MQWTSFLEIYSKCGRRDEDYDSFIIFISSFKESSPTEMIFDFSIPV